MIKCFSETVGIEIEWKQQFVLFVADMLSDC